MINTAVTPACCSRMLHHQQLLVPCIQPPPNIWALTCCASTMGHGCASAARAQPTTHLQAQLRIAGPQRSAPLTSQMCPLTVRTGGLNGVSINQQTTAMLRACSCMQCLGHLCRTRRPECYAAGALMPGRLPMTTGNDDCTLGVYAPAVCRPRSCRPCMYPAGASVPRGLPGVGAAGCWATQGLPQPAPSGPSGQGHASAACAAAPVVGKLMLWSKGRPAPGWLGKRCSRSYAGISGRAGWGVAMTARSAWGIAAGPISSACTGKLPPWWWCWAATLCCGARGAGALGGRVPSAAGPAVGA